MTIFLPETYHPILLKQRAKRMRKENPEEHGDKYAELERADFSLHSIITRTLARPLVMLVVEPIMITVTIYLSVSYSSSRGSEPEADRSASLAGRLWPAVRAPFFCPPHHQNSKI